MPLDDLLHVPRLLAMALICRMLVDLDLKWRKPKADLVYAAISGHQGADHYTLMVV